MSTTAGPEASDQDESRSWCRDWHDARGPGQYVRARRGPGASGLRRSSGTLRRGSAATAISLNQVRLSGTPPLHHGDRMPVGSRDGPASARPTASGETLG
jgi:hypothetical protein